MGNDSILAILVQAKAISLTSAELVTDFAEKWQISLFEALSETKILAREDIAASLARELKISLYIDFPLSSRDLIALEKIKFVDARRLCALAVKYNAENNQLTVVVKDPTNLDAIRDIEKLSGCSLQLGVSDAFVLKEAIDIWYPAFEQISIRD